MSHLFPIQARDFRECRRTEVGRSSLTVLHCKHCLPLLAELRTDLACSLLFSVRPALDWLCPSSALVLSAALPLRRVLPWLPPSQCRAPGWWTQRA
jgi:hypothetical protein